MFCICSSELNCATCAMNSVARGIHGILVLQLGDEQLQKIILAQNAGIAFANLAGLVGFDDLVYGFLGGCHPVHVAHTIPLFKP
jgi:hypothetical protein